MSDRAVAPDPGFERFAEIVRDAVGVPVALVTIVEPDRQIFPGAIGLPEPWQSTRETPLTHSFCQYVVKDAQPLVVSDARTDPRLVDNLAIPDLGVIAYAGFPLANADGTVIGSLCAISGEVHEWSDTELRILANLAEVCSTELVLREARQALSESVANAMVLSRRVRTLLAVSETLARAVTVSDVAVALHDVAVEHLDCVHAGMWLIADDAVGHELQYVHHPSRPWPQAARRSVFALDTANPIGAPLVDDRPLFFHDRAEQDERFPHLQADPSEPSLEGEGEARAVLPLVVAGHRVGTLALVWEDARLFDNEDHLAIAGLASYAAQAVHRAQLLAERTGAASVLQASLLSELPQPDDLELAARYRTAALHDEVGGDWYDAVVMPTGQTHVMVGDVMGHDISATARMGALRNMLRALTWQVAGSPAQVIEMLDRCSADLEVDAFASLILARIEQDEEQRSRGVRILRWSNAGHPPPLLVLPDGTCEVLLSRSRDPMLGAMPSAERCETVREVPNGATVLFYTDGLIETRHADLDVGIDLLVRAAGTHHTAELGDLLDLVLADVLPEGGHDDDTAILAVRFHAQDL